MALIYNTVKAPDGSPQRVKLTVQLVAGPKYTEPGYVKSRKEVILGTWGSQSDDAGFWQVEVEPNTNIDPPGTYYKVIERYNPGNKSTTYFIRVEDAATPAYWIGDILIQNPDAILSQIPASQISFEPGATILSTDVQSALIELSNQITTGTGDAHYTYTQAMPAAEWIVNHQLGKFPSVEVADSSGRIIEGDIQYVDINTVKIVFSSAFSGTAVFN